MPDHYVRHILRPGDYVQTEFECRATEGAPCRTACLTCFGEQRERCECSWLNEVGDARIPNMGDMGACGALPWFEDAPEELYGGPENQPVRGPGWQPINILVGHEGDVYWKYTDDLPSPPG